MCGRLSSNWKNLQQKIQKNTSKHVKKRKREETAISEQKSVPKSSTSLRLDNTSEPTRSKKRKVKNQALAAADSSHGVKPTKPSCRNLTALGEKSASALDNMGNSHVSRLVRVSSQGKPAPAPSVDTAEGMAESQKLGVARHSIWAEDERPNEGRAAGVELGKYVGLDCEMVGVREGGYASILARVSIVDFHGRQVYDSLVKPTERVTDWRTAITGLTPKHMNRARSFEKVQREVEDILRGRIVVGHDLANDMKALNAEFVPYERRRDTAVFQGFKKYGHGRKPALRNLAREILGIDIHQGVHSSLQDARVAMVLFKRYKQSFDLEHINQYGGIEVSSSINRGKSKSKKKRK